MKKIILAGIIGLLIGGVIGYTFSSSQITELQSTKEQMKSQMAQLESQYQQLNQSYHSLNDSYQKNLNSYRILLSNYSKLQKSYRELNHSHEYYMVGDCINLTDIKVIDGGDYYRDYVEGNVTNIGNRSLKYVHVYVIFRDSDGSVQYIENTCVTNLYVGETMPFRIDGPWEYPKYEVSTFEFIVIY